MAARTRLHVVTGKGGTGKTTVAGALALALAADGGQVLLMEVEGRQAIAGLFGREPLPTGEHLVAETPGGGQVRAITVDAEDALLEYLEMFYRLGVAGRALRKVGAVDFATTIAPGMRDVLLTGKVKEAATRTSGGRRVYDAVVLDAPPTGRIGRFLNVTAETARLAKVGPIKSHSDGVAAILRSPLTAVHLVTLLEEMPVQETVDALAELRRLGIPVGRLVINAAAAPAGIGKITQAGVRRGLLSAGLPADKVTVAGLVAQGRAEAARVAVEVALRAELAALGRPTVELPALPGVDRAGLEQLAELLVPAA